VHTDLRVVVLSAAVSVLLGCGDASHAIDQVKSWDSAGVEIVVNPDVPLPEWTIDPAPFVDIGTADGRDGQDLALPWSSVRFGDGRIAISNGQSNELRFYDSDGQFIRSVGREGEGPGEFRAIGLVQLGRADTIIVSDGILSRLTLFSPSGEFGRTIRLEAIENRGPQLRGVLSDTIVLFRIRLYGRSGGRSIPVRDTLLLTTRPLDGGVTTVIGRFPAQEKFNQILPNRSVMGWNLPFGRNVHTAVTGNRVWVGVSDSYELMGFGPTGDLRSVVRLDRPTLRVEQTDRSRFLEHQLSGIEDDDLRRTYESFHQIVDFPETMPAFSALKSDPLGYVWVQDYRPPWEEGEPEWRAFETSGNQVAVLQTPEGLQIQEIGADYVMGLWRDPLGIEHIRVYRLSRKTS